MLTNPVFFTTFDSPVESVSDAVEVLLGGDPVWTLNSIPRCGSVWLYPEALVTVWDRVSAEEAQDEWPGAAYEADLVAPQWRRYRATGSTPWCRQGDKELLAVPTAVRT